MVEGTLGLFATLLLWATRAAAGLQFVQVRSTRVPNRNDAERAPSTRHGFSVTFRECAQSPWVLIMKSGDFPVELTKATV
jgi:hypothetical protein